MEQTTQTSNGSKIKNIISENEQGLKNKETLAAIENFLAENEAYNKSIAWHLHCYCRSGEGDNFGYQHSDLEHTAWFVSNLIKVFMHPKASKIYTKVSGLPATTLADYLTRLQILFETLMSCEVTEARLDEIEVGYFDYDKNDIQLHNTKVRMERDSELAATREQVITKHSKRFKH